MTTQNLARLMDEVVKTPTRLGLALALSLSVMVSGLYVTTVPTQIRERSITSLTNGINAEVAAANTVNLRWEEVDQWYAQSYSDRFDTQLSAVNAKVSEAQGELAIAKGTSNLDQAISAASTGRNKLSEAKELLKAASVIITDAEASRELARSELAERDKLLLGISGARYEMEKHFEVESREYPDSRLDPIRQEIEAIDVQASTIDELMAEALSLLPEADDQSGIGNPARALELIPQISEALSNQNDAVVGARANVDRLTTARREAQPTLLLADQAIASAERHIQTVVHNRGYELDKALSVASSLLAQAKAHSQGGWQAIRAVGKVDFVGVYEVAQTAKSTAEAADVEVDAQIAADEESALITEQLQSGISEVQGLNGRARADLAVLAAQHNESTWSQVANNVYNVKVTIEIVTTQLIKVNRFRAEQQFKEAQNEGRKALANLAEAKAADEAVSSLQAKLEAARASWPGARSGAQSAISSAQGPVSMFAGYSPRAVSGLSSAQALLHEGEGFAADRWFEPAVDRAQRAAVEARSAGRNAQVDYDEEMARRERARQAEIERQRQEQERAAREAREAAERAQQLQEQMNRSYDYGGGGSCCGGGSSYTSPSRSNYDSFSSPSRNNYDAFP